MPTDIIMAIQLKWYNNIVIYQICYISYPETSSDMIEITSK